MPAKKTSLKDALNAILNSNDDDGSGEYVTQIEIVNAGTAIVLPEGMEEDEAIANLARQRDYKRQKTAFIEKVDAFPWDAAVAMSRVLKRRYGWAHSIPTPGFFGPQPPTMISIDTGVNETMQVPWGRFELPGISGWVETDVAFDGNPKSGGRAIFQLTAEVLRKHEHEVKALVDEIRVEVLHNSIYRGKALRVSFPDDDPFKAPRFMDVSGITADSLVYSDHVQSSILTNLIAPLENREVLKRYEVPFKRGVLLAGVFGTGKTLAALHAANRAVAHGVTFVYVERAAEFQRAVSFVRGRFEPALIFCEDIDRVTSGDRTESLDSILNIVDGIDSKTTEIMVVLTTNNVKSISQGMLRPGRLDAVIEVEAPDAMAVQRLIRLYGRGLVSQDARLDRVGALLEGQIPAVVREVVERAKLAAIRLKSFDESGNIVLTDEALVDSANTMRMQIQLLNRKPEMDPSDLERFGTAFGTAAGKGLAALADTLTNGEGSLYVVDAVSGRGVDNILRHPSDNPNYVHNVAAIGEPLSASTMRALSSDSE